MQSEAIDWKKNGVILAKVEMNYKIPILLDDQILVYTWVSRIGNKSFDMDCSMVKVVDGNEIEVALGKAVIVCIDYQTNMTIPVPKLWIEKIEEFEK